MAAAVPTPSLASIDAMRAALRSRLEEHSERDILGAQLGTQVNAVIEGSYKAWMPEGPQNLRAFTEKFLGGLVTPTNRRRGLDYLFEIDGRSTMTPPSFDGALWRAFCAIKPTQRIILSGESGTIHLTDIGSDTQSDDLAITDTVIPYVSADEHKQICLDFVATIQTQSQAAPILAASAAAFQPSIYSSWVATLKSEPGLYKKWGIFRGKKLRDLFAQRLDNLGIDSNARQRLVDLLDADYNAGRQSVTPVPPKRLPPSSPPLSSGQLPEQQTRALLARALSDLDTEQIARIMIPMDVVVALLNRNKT
ncbi:hypothetical protein [Xanthomonas nasturtii]|uniref:hypothetical protein n=1 Tax=Xanthomonas nasturtii TaxID=1843581 RepID=UPI0020124183|nr:hypothetical protein [Xanthomonas nasturtii]MCL1528555.1 hypothetical protein [Xanthomonas nasturtii]MCL1536168.1 hypothetical protein [Xanthomonas nasturtii]MCL1545516.1 hypothetical protein [Xanthomonas nasturtii]